MQLSVVVLLCTASPLACTECCTGFHGDDWLLLSTQTQRLLFQEIPKFEDACLSKGHMLLQKSTKLQESWKQQPSDMPEWLSQTAYLTFQLMNTTQLVDATKPAC